VDFIFIITIEINQIIMQTLSQFITNWSKDYQAKATKLKLFQPGFAASLSKKQKQGFVLTFYHIRGTFYKFLWYIGSIAKSKPYKDIILKNISEEFGQTLSHEEWYFEFAADFGVDIRAEILSQKYNFDWVKEFCDAHLKFILMEDFELAWSAFGAYEKLDNVDYDNLYNFAVGLDSSKKGLVFFDIHRHVEHYENIDPLLQTIWNKKPELVKKSFEFIGNHQLVMWDRLGEHLDDLN
jgi:Iron-containing redox enzyme